ncbi:ABC transporter permease [Paenibacillus sp. MBLB4367]|uniref:ABC transporter permease n=1 Tax=Paenibacillus sp. MBLB4367 TaxID=3384767 RepID=UPI003907EC31
MAILFMILRKMAKNKWQQLSLLSGLVLSVALVSSIPIYTDAILQRMLVKDLENLQKSTETYPGIHYSSVYLGAATFWDTGAYKPEERPQVVKDIDDFMRNEASPSFGLPVNLLVKEQATEIYSFVPADTAKIESGTKREAKLAARSGLNDHIRLIDGRLPASQPVDGVYEVLVVEEALLDFNMVLGNVFVMEDEETKTKVAVQPVGVIGKKDDADPFWYEDPANYSKTFFIDDGLFDKDFATGKVLPPVSASWLFVLDYAKTDLEAARSFVRTSERIDTLLYDRFNTYTVAAPAKQTVEAYFKREASLKRILWSLHAPVMIMLALYLYMVANLITEQQKTEIAVLRSRGASRSQVLLGYVAEGVLLGALAFAAGPPAGMFITKILGASNGFLEFVNRSALPVHMNADAYRYALYAVAGSVFMTLIPAYFAARATIVSQKQQAARRQSQSFWHLFFLDVALVAVSFYGLRLFGRQREDMLRLAAEASDFSVDPLLFLVPALFILGMGLLVLRLYPWFVRFVYWLGRKRWPPSLYSTLIQVGRSGTQYQFVMMFLIMTTAMGLYSASAARTLNSNTEQKIMYHNGADIILKPDWPNDAPLANRGGPPGGVAPDTPAAPDEERAPRRIQYVEPPFQPIAELPGLESAAKVFVKNDASFSSGKEQGKIKLMGIDSDEFGRTAWLRDGLLGHHFFDYLNLIASDPRAVLISRSIADKGVKTGDTVQIDWNGVEPRPFTVYGIIDYWPGFNPSPTADPNGKKPQTPALVVGHLQYMQNALALEPYEVWIKLKEGAERQPFYDAVTAKRINLVSLTDTREELANAKNDPFQLAVNGVMTLGFVISAVICFFGFLLYWVLSLSRRVLQFGVLRAMGVSFPQLIGMLTAEQLLTSGAAVLIGGAVGAVTSRLFVTLFQVSFDPAKQVPPFQIVFDPNDSMQLLLIVTVMIAFGLFILGWLLSRIKIHQAIKLGED